MSLQVLSQSMSHPHSGRFPPPASTDGAGRKIAARLGP